MLPWGSFGRDALVGTPWEGSVAALGGLERGSEQAEGAELVLYRYMDPKAEGASWGPCADWPGHHSRKRQVSVWRQASQAWDECRSR